MCGVYLPTLEARRQNRPVTKRSPKRGGRGWLMPTEDAVLRASTELIELVEAQMPQRFYRGEHPWQWMGAAIIARMADTVEAMMSLMKSGHAVDGLVLLRALYEQVVVYCWASIDRDTNPERWRLNGLYWLRKFHTDALAFGQKVLTKRELAEVQKGEPGLALIDMAAAVDKHWGSRLIGFRPPRTNPGDILTFRGLYVAIYRMGSRAAHVEADSLGPYLDYDVYPKRVHRSTRDDSSIWWPLAVPLYAQALLVCNEQMNWPDPERVKAINNAMYAQQ
jgi:hypothetical protein